MVDGLSLLGSDPNSLSMHLCWGLQGCDKIESIFGEPDLTVALANCGFPQAGTCQDSKGCSAKILGIGSGGRKAHGLWEPLMRESLNSQSVCQSSGTSPVAWSMFDRGVSESMDTVQSIEPAGM